MDTRLLKRLGPLRPMDIALASVAIYLLKRLVAASRAAPLPPGPRGIPFLGNITSWPKENEWETFAQWGEQYGAVVYASLFGQPIVFLNTPQAASDLLDKRSALYSDRPDRTMLRLAGFLQGLLGCPNNDRLRRLRALVARSIGSRAGVAYFAEMAQLETHRFLRQVAATPDALQNHIRHNAGSIILNITYGYQVHAEKDLFVDLAQDAMQTLSRLATQVFLVDAIPILRFLPEWLPGTRFLQIARDARDRTNAFRNVPYEYVKQQLRSGSARPSFVAQHLENPDGDPGNDELIQSAAVAIYGGKSRVLLLRGSDTIVSANYTFFLVMALYPDVQRRAQAEIDAVVGAERLPTLADRDRLPYMIALVKEILRWSPPARMGAPHRLRQEDVYNGYRIPKNALVIGNVWKMLHDPTIYPSPFKFDPSRFIVENGRAAQRDPADFCFGFGRRVCPGSILAETTVFLSCALSLAVFDISNAVDGSNRVVEPAVAYASGTVNHPKPFKCSVKPRSAKAAALIKAVELFD